MNTSSDYDKAIKDPTLVYRTPGDVLADPGLNDEQRLQILKRWEQDQRELQVAQEEGMSGGEENILKEILDAMETLDVHSDTRDAPTKQGGPID